MLRHSFFFFWREDLYIENKSRQHERLAPFVPPPPPRPQAFAVTENFFLPVPLPSSRAQPGSDSASGGVAKGFLAGLVISSIHVLFCLFRGFHGTCDEVAWTFVKVSLRRQDSEVASEPQTIPFHPRLPPPRHFFPCGPRTARARPHLQFAPA